MKKKLKQIVVGFPCDKYDFQTMAQVSDRRKHELALEDEEVIIYDCTEDYFADLTNGLTNPDYDYSIINVE